MMLPPDWLQRANAKLLSGLNPGHFGLTIFPTERCNFRCPYCYEDHSGEDMTRRIIEGIKNLITHRSRDMDSISVGWFGGEPLLAKNTVCEIADHILTLQAHGHTKFGYTSFMSTNGWLLDLSTAHELVSRGIRSFQITLDGAHDLHDRTRVLASGVGTFDRIWSNLVDLRESTLSFQIFIRIHFHKGNLCSIPMLAKELNRVFASDTRFRACAHVVEDLGGSNSFRPLCGSYSKTLGTKHLLDSLLDQRLRIDPRRELDYICYASKPNNLCIRADGSVAKCTVALNDPKNRIGVLTEDGQLHIDKDLYEFWIRGFATLAAEDLACPSHTSSTSM